MRKIPKIKCEHKKKEAFTEMEIEELRMQARDERDSAVVEFLLSTGCRVSEAVQVRLDEIDGDRVMVHGKGQKDRYVYLNAKAKVAIDAYLKERKDNNPYLFPGSYYCCSAKSDEHGQVIRKQRHNWWKFPEAVHPDKHGDITLIQNITRAMAKRAGIEEGNPHKFRHTCATMALRRGMSLEQVSKMLGHEELSTTQIYLDIAEDELEQAHKKYVV